MCSLLSVCLGNSRSNYLLKPPGSNNQIIVNRNGAYGSALVVTDATGSNLTAPGLIQAWNIPNACVSVDSQGAVGDRTTQRWTSVSCLPLMRRRQMEPTPFVLAGGKIYKVSDTRAAPFSFRVMEVVALPVHLVVLR